MLSTLLGSSLALLVGAAAVVKPIPGAFGLRFDEPAPPNLLGASIAAPRYAELPDNLPPVDPELPVGSRANWYYFTPEALPELLAADDVRFTVMVDADFRPLRILAERSPGECDQTFGWMTESLGKKYLANDDPKAVPRNGFVHGARFIHNHYQVDVACGRTLLIEYTDGQGLLRWQAQSHAALAEQRGHHARLEQARAAIQRIRRRQFADTFTQGDQVRLDGALGVSFGAPFPLPADHPVDEPFSVTLGNLPEPFAGGAYELTVGPQGEPIKLEGRISDGDGSAFAEVRAALAAKYGPPLKNGRRHVVHRVNGNFFVLRRLGGLGELNIVVIDARAERDQQARAEASAARAFEQATTGL